MLLYSCKYWFKDHGPSLRYVIRAMVSMIQEYHLRGSLRAFWVWVLRDPDGTPYFFPLFGTDRHHDFRVLRSAFCVLCPFKNIEHRTMKSEIRIVIKESLLISPMLIYNTLNLILTFGMIRNYD
jgi:hypothetical protein